MEFMLINQNSLNVGIAIKCSGCGKPYFLYSKKPFLTGIQCRYYLQCINRTAFSSVFIIRSKLRLAHLETITLYGKFTCVSPIEIPILFQQDIFKNLLLMWTGIKVFAIKRWSPSIIWSLSSKRSTKSEETKTKSYIRSHEQKRQKKTCLNLYSFIPSHLYAFSTKWKFVLDFSVISNQNNSRSGSTFSEPYAKQKTNLPWPYQVVSTILTYIQRKEFFFHKLPDNSNPSTLNTAILIMQILYFGAKKCYMYLLYHFSCMPSYLPFALNNFYFYHDFVAHNKNIIELSIVFSLSLTILWNFASSISSFIFIFVAKV